MPSQLDIPTAMKSFADNAAAYLRDHSNGALSERAAKPRLDDLMVEHRELMEHHLRPEVKKYGNDEPSRFFGTGQQKKDLMLSFVDTFNTIEALKGVDPFTNNLSALCDMLGSIIGLTTSAFVQAK